MKKLLLLSVLLTQLLSAQQPRIYYTDYAKTINSISLSGNDDNVILTSFNNPTGISFYNDKLYISDDNLVNRTYRFNPDGNSGKIMHDETDGAIKPSSVAGFNNELYFIDNNFIRKSDINGENVIDILELTSTPVNGKLQVIGNIIYWNAGSALRGVNIDGSGEFTVNDNGTTFRGFWIDGDEIFYIVDSVIKKSFIDGSNETVLLSPSSPNLSSPIDLTVIDQRLYYTDTGLDKIMRSDLDGSNSEEVFDITGFTANPNSIAGYNGFVYWSDNNKNSVSRISVGLTNFEVILGDEFVSVNDIAFTENELIFSDSYIKKSNTNGGMISTITSGIETTIETRVSGNEIYFTNFASPFGIMKTPTDTYSPESLISSQTTSFINSFDRAGDFIYWIENNENNSGSVYRALVDGSNVEILYTDSQPLYNIEFSNNRLYFTKGFQEDTFFAVDVNGTNPGVVFGLTGSMNNFTIHNEVVYFGWSREDSTFDLASVNLDASNLQILKSLPTTINDIDIFEPTNNQNTDDYNALVALYNSTNGANWTNTWDLGAPISTYFGITLDANNRVSQIVLNENNLVGTLPTELGNLSNLTLIALQDNQLSGTIPRELGNLSNLTGIGFKGNQLTGQIPRELGNLSNLTILSLFNNQLSGTIPTELGNLTNLTSLSVSTNQLTGTIPSELGNLSILNGLFLFGNQLSGSIPSELGNLNNLNSLSLDNNQLTGAIPSTLGNLSNLTRLSLWGNQLTGNIPQELGNLTALNDLFLARNSLSGSLPPQLGNLSSLTGLTLNNNSFSGVIPVEFGSLVNLTFLTLQSNQLEGAIPSELSNLTNLETLFLNNNSLNIIPQELNALSNLSSVNISNNNFIFLDIENIFAQYQTIETFTYAPQNIFGNPENNIDLDEGTSTTLGSLFTSFGSSNNTYQWFKDDVAIDGATNPELQISNASEDNAGIYTLRVNNTVITDLELQSGPVTVNVNSTTVSNYLLVTDTTIFKGTTENVDIQLLNNTEIRGFQFDVTLPNGFVFDTADLITTDRLTGFEVSVSNVGGNTYRVLGFSFSSTTTIAAGSDAIITLPIFVDDSVVPEEYILEITNVTLSNPSNEDVATNPLDFGTITILEFALGDSNGNGNVDILDLLQTVDFILGNNPSPFEFTAADINMDMTISILDVLGAQDIILSGRLNTTSTEYTTTSRVSSSLPTNNYLLVNDKTVLPNTNDVISIALVNDAIVRGFQFDITLPTGFTLDVSNISATGPLAGFILSSSDLGNNVARVLAFSVTGQTLPVNSGDIINLPISIDSTTPLGDYSFSIDNVTLSDVNNMDIASTPSEVGSITVSSTLGISDSSVLNTMRMYPNPTSDVLNIEFNQSIILEKVEIYNNLGQLVRSAKSFRIDVSSLSGGIYFVEIITDIGKTSRKLVIK